MANNKKNTPSSGEGYIFTFQQIGNHVKVTATEEQSGIEISTIAPYTLSQTDMQTLALKKLKLVLKKQHDNNT